jgi:hypothetical protein
VTKSQSAVLFCVALLGVVAAALAQDKAPKEEWIQLFNGKNLDGWVVKVKGFDVGNNYANTFRVENGLLKVVYEKGKYEPFRGKFGHLFHKEKFSHYILRAEYRFVGEQAPGGPNWAIRNSGLMIHGESPETMGKNQDFPVSIEVQLLGGNGKDERSTANLCTPGTNVVMDGKLVMQHCNNSTSKTYHGDQWVTVEVEVHGSRLIRHKVNGQVVLEYTDPQYDDREEHSKELAAKQGGKLLIDHGTISLQSESHPVEFRKIELLKLKE